ncbi:MAG: hypothetical protein ACKVS9_13735, partial [Phycisphaerae bacterium]
MSTTGLSIRAASASDLGPLSFFFDTALRRDYFSKRPVNPVYYPACGVAMMPPSKRRPSWHAVRGGIQTKNRSG